MAGVGLELLSRVRSWQIAAWRCFAEIAYWMLTDRKGRDETVTP